ncbi:uncharacterized protein A4U43_C05F32010 [Asparagus officinalis]|uniref:Uncharacterized protein n=1 Tax=Asparagus officinalis TaxID=4686 RepID=A0A5P1F0M1_ASPOF|nr:uncharacterized protein LOC109841080 [Asparagus officinalis]ONK70271.1 uncharacterized protein A4U43_C05F32010 [Asparagus officinalis]
MGKEKPLLPSKSVAFARCVSRPDDELKWFRSCLRWMCVDQSTTCHTLVSCSLFFLLAIVVPVMSHFFLVLPEYYRPYDTVVQLSLTAASLLSFFCLSASFRKYGLRKFLFLDKICGDSERVRVGYSVELNRSFRILSFFVLPCFVAECGYKVWCYCAGARRISFLGNAIASDILACILELASWLYRTAIFLLVCVLFCLICHLQILRLQDFTKVFQEESDVASILQEHLRIRRHLMVISHRFRKFIIGVLTIVTVSQFAALLLTTRPSAVVTLFDTGELALSSIGLVTGLLICLCSAAKITHKAQAIKSHATKWHVSATIDFSIADPDTPSEFIASSHSFPEPNHANGEDSDESEEGDEDELEATKIVQPNATTISYQKRQALVTYLENNMAGITLFGFMLDRGYLHAVFMFQLSLILWLLGKTIGIS